MVITQWAHMLIVKCDMSSESSHWGDNSLKISSLAMKPTYLLEFRCNLYLMPGPRPLCPQNFVVSRKVHFEHIIKTKNLVSLTIYFVPKP